ncbi:MAG: hypothetical protein ABL901_01035 [Hyphomicrobiaceae bacterium]
MPDITFRDAILAIIERSAQALAKMGMSERAQEAFSRGLLAGETERADMNDWDAAAQARKMDAAQ